MGPQPKPLQYGCDDLWAWNRFERSPEVKIYGKACQVAYFHPHWSSGSAGVRGTCVLNDNRHFWELRLNKRIFGTSIMFGIGTKKARLHENQFINLLGQDDNSWVLSHKGELWHGGRWDQYTEPFRENEATVIGILFDGFAGTLTYYKDGVCLGIAFRGLSEIKEPLYPIICSTASKTQITLEFMKRDFINLQDRCRTVIVKRVKYKKDLEKLLIPLRIRGYLSEAMTDITAPFKKVNQNVSRRV